MKHRQEHQHSLPHPVCATQVDGAGSNVQGDSYLDTVTSSAAIISSISFARVARARLGDEHDMKSIIWAVPDSSSSGHLVLPLLQHLALDGTGAQIAPQPVLPAGVGPVSRFS